MFYLRAVFLAQRLAKKVPELTIYFWVIKVSTTGMGEATSDFLSTATTHTWSLCWEPLP